MTACRSLVAAVLIPLALCGADKPPVWECFKVDALNRVDSAHYEQISHNACPYEIPRLYVLIKFFDKNGTRIGSDFFLADWVSPGEHLKKTFAVPPDVAGFASVGLRKITADVLDLP